MLILAGILIFGTMFIGLGYIGYLSIQNALEEYKLNKVMQRKKRFDMIIAQTNLKESE